MTAVTTRRCLLAALLSGMAWTGLAGAAAQETVPVVKVAGALSERDEKSYRDMLAGIKIFEQQRQLAPGSTLRFKVLPRRDGVDMASLALQIVGAHGAIAVPLDADHSFVLPVEAEAAGADAMVRFNRPSGSLAWRAEIRSPGVPANARRLGDLMLECKVNMAADLVAYIHHPINMMVIRLADPCRSLPINLFSFADRPLFGITLVAGERRSVLSAAMLHGPALVPMPSQEDWLFLRDRAYTVKYKALYDQHWPDDTLLTFSYLDDEQ
ncbi:hypothetical protein [Massilia sp. S19_KUP03_FR1]|uniref:hypothetical protein n=1 Tax=Massilia sp. S19_KUP03_FR1 TaxID=3025503 RepID=UPI002FCD6BF7